MFGKYWKRITSSHRKPKPEQSHSELSAEVQPTQSSKIDESLRQESAANTAEQSLPGEQISEQSAHERFFRPRRERAITEVEGLDEEALVEVLEDEGEFGELTEDRSSSLASYYYD
ncbi:MAG: hypothetical protein MJE77_12620 [Proteobacteria bacterium]|nr:hypothetical protein [Pseudomonadota bacterium]